MSNEDFEINENFSLTTTGFIMEGIPYSFSDIAEISFWAHRMKINFVPTGTDFEFYIKLQNEKIFKVNSTFKILSRKKLMERLGQAYVYLSKQSFHYRMFIYLGQLKGKGFCDYTHSNIRIFENGDVTYKNKTVNLKKAVKEGQLWFGRTRGLEGSHYYSADPNRVVVSETKSTFLPGKNKMSFDCTVNKDVMFSLLKTIAYSNTGIEVLMKEYFEQH